MQAGLEISLSFLFFFVCLGEIFSRVKLTGGATEFPEKRTKKITQSHNMELQHCFIYFTSDPPPFLVGFLIVGIFVHWSCRPVVSFPDHLMLYVK